MPEYKSGMQNDVRMNLPMKPVDVLIVKETYRYNLETPSCFEFTKAIYVEPGKFSPRRDK